MSRFENPYGYSDEELERIKNLVVDGIEKGLRMDQIDVGPDYYINEQAAIIYLTIKNPDMQWHLFGAKPAKPLLPGTPAVDDAALPTQIPDKVDYRNLCSAVENQGQMSSCVGNATVGIRDVNHKEKYLSFFG